jgi:hypothetical protein
MKGQMSRAETENTVDRVVNEYRSMYKVSKSPPPLSSGGIVVVTSCSIAHVGGQVLLPKRGKL